MAYCRYCGAEVRSSDAFCFTCGRPLEIRSQSPAQNATASPEVTEMKVILSPARVVVVGILSYGFYFFYWSYLTWKHYRDHTKTENYPVWHALALFVPVYCLFRMHAHIRSFKELMTNAGLASGPSPNLGVGLFMISNVLGGISLLFTMGGEPTRGAALVLNVLSTVSIIWLPLYVQNNLNRYWKNLKNARATNARLGVGEVITCLFGILIWIGTLMPAI